jgi:hypothetical protein
MPALGDTFKTEMQKPWHVRQPILTIAQIQWNGTASIGFEGSTFPHFYSDSPSMLAATAPADFVVKNGVMEPRLLSVSPITYAIQSHAPAAIQRVQAQIVLDDADRVITQLLEGEFDQRRVAIRLWWATQEDQSHLVEHTDLDGNPSSFETVYDWQPLFTGILDKWEQNGSSWSLTAHVDDFWMTGSAPKTSILVGDWNVTPTDAVGVRVPIVYGHHDGTNHSGTGFCKAVKGRWESGSAGWYAASVGTLESVDNVYVDGVLKTITTHYTLDYAYNGGGKVFTIIKFAGADTPAATAQVTFDCHGLTNDTTQAGGMLQNPVAQLRHLIANFLFADWKRGSEWFSEAGILDVVSWNAAESYADQLAIEGSIFLGGNATQTRIADVIGAWLQSWQMFRVHWTPDGKLAIRILPVEHPGYGDGTVFDLIRPEDEIRAVHRGRMETERLTQRIVGTYIKDAAGNRLWNTLEVQDVNVDEDTAPNVALEHGLARLA